MRVALVHDYLNQRGGAERVFAHIARAYPDAPVYTALHDPSLTSDFIDPSRVRASWLQRLPAVHQYFRYLAPLYPRVFEGFDLRPFDTIVSSTSAWAKGVVTPPAVTHVCYINTVSRFAFAYDAYVGGLVRRGATAPLAPFARRLVQRLVAWDRRAAERPTAFIANSRNVAQRVKHFYARDAYVLPAPVDLERFTVGAGRGDYALVVSRLLPYKRIDLAIVGCAQAGVPLRIVGTGPAESSLRSAARGTQTTFCGAISDAELNRLMGDARAVIVPGEEDFGLVPLEAAAAGRPAIALGRGGALETILPGVTGEHFFAAEPSALAAILSRFDSARYDARALRAHAEQFSAQRFIERLRAIVDEVHEQTKVRAREG
ncbi:MAG: glycosyltransferase [Candidatus Eremiobacteraeota bacterium]|nr:glycosyltransferase [Candidatus Eremiobacteraeota bacterium]MBV9647596.1 glycosyltransferase [Candidatus Eremiobacteraeota bacterium]